MRAKAGKHGESDEETMPARIDGIAMAARNRAGEVYCVEYQRGSCGRPLVDQHSGAGKLLQAKGCDRGLHRCAALFCSGRTCHGDHPGSQCRQRRRLNEIGAALPTADGAPHNGEAHTRTAAAGLICQPAASKQGGFFIPTQV